MIEIKRPLKPTGKCRESNRNFYTVNYQGEEYTVPMFPHQVGQSTLPAELPCLIREENNSLRIVQDPAAVIADLYRVGDVYRFLVKGFRGSYYNVADTNGLIFRLTEYGSKRLADGQHVKARVISIKGARMNLRQVDDEGARRDAAFRSASELSAAIGADPDVLQGLLDRRPELRARHDAQEATWALDAVEALDEELQSRALWAGGEATVGSVARAFQALCLYLLEGSDMLKHTPQAERTAWIARISHAAQHAEDYMQALAIGASGNAREYIDSQLSRLSDSGYLYQPERKLRTLMCLLHSDERLVPEIMDRVFQIILEGDKAHWGTEPFRPAFVSMLELFIAEYRYKAVQSPGPELLHKMIKAIAIQLLLSHPDDPIDRRLNLSTYYRFLAYVQRYASTQILHLAYHTLFARFPQRLEYEWDHISSLDSLYLKASQAAKMQTHAGGGQALAYRSADGLELAVTPSGITLRPVDGRPRSLSAEKMLDWEGLRIMANATTAAKAKADASFNEVQAYWADVEEALWHPDASRRRLRPGYSEGDRVYLRVVGEDEKRTAFYCEIVDRDTSGHGWLPINASTGHRGSRTPNISSFFKEGNANSLKFFSDRDGTPYVLPAVVMTEPDEDGNYEFSMLQPVSEHLSILHEKGDTLSFTMHTATLHPDEGDVLVGVSADGGSCLVYRDETVCTLSKGESAQVEIDHINADGQYVCTLKKKSYHHTTVPDAISALMRALAVDPLTLDPDSGGQAVTETLEPVEVQAIIGILDRQGVLADDRRVAYSCLSVASMLSRLIGDTASAAYYDKRRQLLRAFDDYERNGSVDAGRLERLRANLGDDLISNDYQVNASMTQFQILDSLKHKENVEALFKIRQTATNTSIRDAADLAIASLLTARFELPGIERMLHERINSELGVKVRTSKLRDFGIESQTQEFKSSIIYAPGTRMQPSRELQQTTILQVICGFLNSRRGGTLYLGVNKAGASCGVDNDLTFLHTDEDGYSRYISQLIIDELGVTANEQCRNVEWITDGPYRIYAMHIEPSAELVKFRGDYWLRQDTERRILPPDEVEKFVRERNKAMNQAASASVKK